MTARPLQRSQQVYRRLLASIGSTNTSIDAQSSVASDLRKTRKSRELSISGKREWFAGDYAKGVIITLVAAFLVMLLLHETQSLNIFSESYLQDGFCISNKDGPPALHGHMLAFYSDTFMTLVMVALALYGKRDFGMGEAALSPISKNAVSLLGHGCGHLFLGVATLYSSQPGMIFEELSIPLRIITWVLLAPVWYGFMRDRSRSFHTACCLAALHNTLQVFFLPTRFFFTHVLMAVLLNSALRWLNRPAAERRNKYYAMESWLVDVPIVLASFFEAITCDSFLVRWGGHVWFDLVVPISHVHGIFWHLGCQR